jgi:hypothetical protein
MNNTSDPVCEYKHFLLQALGRICELANVTKQKYA